MEIDAIIAVRRALHAASALRQANSLNCSRSVGVHRGRMMGCCILLHLYCNLY